jgi:serine/threonine protein kinase/Tol biopolymer transport system component
LISAGTKLGRYEIRSKIGEGGMGEVYLARDTSELGRSVALKIVSAEVAKDKDRLQRLTQEARTVSNLNHPNILTIYEFGQTESVSFIATEFVDGVTLREHLSNRRLKLIDVLDVAIQIVGALNAAHEAGVTHRDLKPENVMVRKDRIVKVLDFGLAKLAQPPAAATGSTGSEDATRLQVNTTPGLIMGTVSYMSPEQSVGGAVDQRSDIWSAGVVLYEMIAGRVPFQGKDVHRQIIAIQEQEPPPLSQQVEGVPERLEEIVMKCLAKEKDERYQTAKDLLIDLRNLRRKLDVDAEIERTAAPALRSTSAAQSPGTQSAQMNAGTTASATQASTASSAEYIVTELKRHKKGVVVALAVFALAAAGLAFALYKFSAKKPAPFQSIKVTKLTNVGNATTAQISPNGEYVAHVFYENGKSSVRVWDVATKSRIEIVPPTEDGLAVNTFSPDSRYIYYLKFVNGQPNVLYQIAVLGGTPKKILETLTSGVSFSPDGKQMVFVRGAQVGDNSLIIASADGSGERTLATRKNIERFGRFAPAWSPDGRTIACGVHVDGTNMTVAAVSVADGTVKPITSPKWLAVGRVAWLSDGTGLVFSADEDVTQVWYVSYPGGAVRRITNDANNYGTGSLSVTADSSTIATLQAERTSYIFVGPTSDPAAAKRITGASSGLTRPAGISWTPDDKLVYSTIASGNADIWIANVDGTGGRQLTNDPAVDTGPEVSPDGRYVVFQSTRSGRFNLWRSDLDGGNLKQLTSGGDDAIPNFSPDGKWVIYDSIVTTELRKVPIDGGDSVRLTDRRVAWPTVSPKDGMIAGLYRSDGNSPQRLTVFAPEGGTPIKNFDLPPGALSNPRWTTDGRAIIYIITRADASSLWSQSLDGGKPVQLADFSPEQIFSFDLSRDGRWLAFSRGTIIRDVILITDTSKQ